MAAKIVGIFSLLILPLSASLWIASHRHPQHRRYDLTLYKSVWVYLHDGICYMHMLSMPTKVASRTRFDAPLSDTAIPNSSSLMFRTSKQGQYRNTWLAFPFWATTSLLAILGTVSLATGPLVRWRRTRNGWCIHCGYDLHTNRTGRCPECGMRFTRTKSTRRR